MSHHQWWLNEASLVQSEDAHLHAALLLIVPSTILAPFLCMSKSSVIIFLFLCPAGLRPFERSTDDRWTTYLPVGLSPACWRPPAHCIIFYPLTSHFEHLVPLRNCFARHGVISINLLKHFECLGRSFPHPDPKISDLFVVPVFITRSSALIAE